MMRVSCLFLWVGCLCVVLKGTSLYGATMGRTIPPSYFTNRPNSFFTSRLCEFLTMYHGVEHESDIFGNSVVHQRCKGSCDVGTSVPVDSRLVTPVCVHLTLAGTSRMVHPCCCCVFILCRR